MGILRSSTNPEPQQTRKGITRRQFLVGTAATGAALATVFLGRNRIGEWLHAPGHYDPEHGPAPITPEVKRELIHNRDELLRMDALGTEPYLNELQSRDRILVPESEVLEIDIYCVDERQRNGLAHGVAGVGVLLDPTAREELARNIVRKARAKFERTRWPVHVRIQPHLAGKCGAAKLSLHKKGVDKPSPAQIDQEAQAAAMLLRADVQRVAREEGVPVQVEINPFPESDFLQESNHPGGLAIVNTLPERVLKTRHSGPLAFNVSHIEGPTQAESDAFLSAIIALKTGHGMHDRPDLGIPPDLPFKIAIAGRGDVLAEMKQRYDHDLKRHPELGEEYERRRVVVHTWEVPPTA